MICTPVAKSPMSFPVFTRAGTPGHGCKTYSLLRKILQLQGIDIAQESERK